MVSVDVKHHVYLLKLLHHSVFIVWKFKSKLFFGTFSLSCQVQVAELSLCKSSSSWHVLLENIRIGIVLVQTWSNQTAEGNGEATFETGVLTLVFSKVV